MKTAVMNWDARSDRNQQNLGITELGLGVKMLRGLLSIKRLSYLSLVALSLVPMPVNADVDDKAETLQNHGLALYRKELYDEAAQAFRELLTLRPSQQVYFNIGQCEFMRKRFDLALEALTNYLAGDKNKITDRRREYTERVIEEIYPRVGSLDIRGESRLEIWIDDEYRGSTPLNGPLYVLEGERRVVFKKEGEILLMEMYDVTPGETITILTPIVVTRTTAPPPPEVETDRESRDEPATKEIDVPKTRESVPSPPPERERSPMKSCGIITTSLGSITLISGITMGAVALSKNSDLKRRCPDKEETCLNSNQSLSYSAVSFGTAANVLLPIGAITAIAGVILTVVGHRKNKRLSESGNPSAWRLAPYVGRNGFGIAILARF